MNITRPINLSTKRGKKMKRLIMMGFICVFFFPWIAYADLIAYYPFHGNAKDASVNENDGIVYGATLTEDRFGNPNSAYNFDGENDYIDLGNNYSLNPTDAISLAAWYKPSSFGGIGNNSIIDKGYISGVGAYQYHLGVTGDLYSTYDFATFQMCVDNYGQYTAFDFWEAGNWYFIAGIYDGLFLKLYVDGEFIGSMSANGSMEDYGKSVCIAKFSNTDSFTPGVIDDVRIYDHVLSETEVQTLYEAPNPVPEPATIFLFGSGLICLAGFKRKFKKSQA
jgi:hypothetical protein